MTSADPGSPDRLQAHVRALEGIRHPRHAPEGHRAAMEYMAGQFEAAGLRPFLHASRFRGRRLLNVAASIEGTRPEAPRVLLGAHYDTVRRSPGADDNASGLALLAEAAHLLAQGPLRATVELVAFDLEEFQGTTYRVGSRRWVERALEDGVRYDAAFILEMVGYADPDPGSQWVPFPLRWKGIPSTGDFIAVVADARSRELLPHYRQSARRAAPALDVVTLQSPLRGWLLWNTRRSDHASFWSAAQPAVMITDTAFLRNPHYHRPTDTAETLDYAFLSRVTAATVEAARHRARFPPGAAR